MKNIYILILFSLIACAEKKEKTAEGQVESVQEAFESPAAKTEDTKESTIEYSVEDISGEYELIHGKSHIIDGETDEIFKAAIVIEKLSETDFGFYSAKKIKDISPYGRFGVFRKMKNRFHKLAICNGRNVPGYTKDNFTTGLYIHNEVFIFTKGDSLGIVQYGSNFKTYMLYKKNKSDLYTSLVKTMKNTKLEYQEFLAAYDLAKNYDTSKLQVNYLNDDEWKTEHIHHESYANYKKRYGYEDPHQEGKFIKEDAIFESQFKNQDENAALENLNFDDVIHAIATRPIPLTESTNFDDFIEAEDHKTVATKALKIEKIYPDFNTEGFGFRAIRSYKVELSKEFYTVVVTILKGEHEMESVLINYDLNGKIIDSKVVSYDEIAEGMSKIESRISENSVTTNHISWDLIKEIEQKKVMINKDGTIDEIDSKNLSSTLTNYVLILDVLEQLKLTTLEVKTDLIVSKAIPQNLEETIVVIPEIVGEGEHHFELNTHIVLINNFSGKISHQYFESAQTNNWVSDAVQLKELKIDTAPYIIAENERVFGIRVYFYGSSQANPYRNEAISLFMKSGNTLKKILSNYDVMNYGGERVTDCNSEFLSSKATLAISSKKTNEYFDITVKNTITETKNYEDQNGDCESKDETTTETTILKFNGTTYKEE